MWSCTGLEVNVKAFVSWSGGKETLLSCFRAMKDTELEIVYLLNMVSDNGRYSRSHGISSGLMRLQAEAIGIPITQIKTSWGDYEQNFKKAVLNLKQKGIEAGIFGDIDLQEHRDWIERVCGQLEIQPVLPLWKEKREELLEELIGAGFAAIVIATRADFLGEEWLGSRINRKFVDEIKQRDDIDLCGEKGEYHTFVYDGPIFKKRINIGRTTKVKRDSHWFLDISRYILEKKI
jgi:uncharacterized protein (TIGR00290 family)